jgi:hypothetical protein
MVRVTELLSRLSGVKKTGADRWVEPLPSLDYLRECFELDEAVVLRWRVRPLAHFQNGRGKQWNARWGGKAAGCLDGDYFTVGITLDGELFRFMRSRLVFALAHGQDPWPLFVDHINHNKADDRPENLRLATNRQNVANQAGARRDNRLGVRGVTWSNRLGKYVVQVGPDDGGSRHVGVFPTLEAASEAADMARLKAFGEYAGGGRGRR